MANNIKIINLYLSKRGGDNDVTSSFNNVINFKTDAVVDAYYQFEQIGGNWNVHLNDLRTIKSLVLSTDDNFSILDLLTIHYLKMTFILEDDTTFNYYYFINNQRILREDKVSVDLKLDIFTTFKINKDFKISNVMMERRHLKRYVYDSGSWKINEEFLKNKEPEKFDDLDSVPSFILEKKEINDITTKNLTYFQGADEVKEKLIQSLKGWFYIYVKATDIKDYLYCQRLKVNQDANGTSVLKLPYVVYLVPCLDAKQTDGMYCYFYRKTENEPLPEEIDKSKSWNLEHVLQALKDANKEIIGIKLLPSIPPELIRIYKSSRIWNPDASSITAHYDCYYFFMYDTDNQEYSEPRVLNGFYMTDAIEYESEDIDLVEFSNKILQIPQQGMGRVNYDIKYELGLMRKPYTSIFLKTGYDQGQEYDFFDLLLNKIPFAFKIKMSSYFEDDRVFYEIKPRENLENLGFDFSYFGDTKDGYNYSINAEYTSANDQLASFKAENKNFLMSSLLTNLSKTGMGLVSGLMMPINPAISGVMMMSGIVAGASGVIQDLFKMDSLSNSPDKANIVQTSPLFNYNFSEIFLSLYLKSIRFNKREIIGRVFYWDGYRYSKIENSTEWFVRQRFNYIQIKDDCVSKIEKAETDSIVYNYMTDEIKSDISVALNNGVRFWEIQYLGDNQWGIYPFEKTADGDLYENWEVGLV